MEEILWKKGQQEIHIQVITKSNQAWPQLIPQEKHYWHSPTKPTGRRNYLKVFSKWVPPRVQSERCADIGRGHRESVAVVVERGGVVETPYALVANLSHAGCGGSVGCCCRCGGGGCCSPPCWLCRFHDCDCCGWSSENACITTMTKWRQYCLQGKWKSTRLQQHPWSLPISLVTAHDFIQQVSL